MRHGTSDRASQIDEVTDGLFEGEEPVLLGMGVQIASEKRRNQWTPPSMACCSVWRRPPSIVYLAGNMRSCT